MSYPAVRQWLVEHTSLEPSLLQGAGFEALVAERLAMGGSGSELEYVAALKECSEEVDRLTSGIAVQETWFFRYPQSFRLLVEFLERRRSEGADSIRMLSVGCATGEEPYSMAMAALHAGWTAGSIHIEALDRSARALQRAEAAEFGAPSIRAEVPAWAASFLRESSGVIRVDSAVRALVNFQRADATQIGAIGASPPLDAIFCRNLLIYLGEEARKRLLTWLRDALAPGGLLFVGHAEPLLCAAATIRPVAAPHTFALERVLEGSPRLQAPLAPPSVQSRPAQPRPPKASPSRKPPTAGPPIVAPEPTIDDAHDLADAGRSEESEALIRAILARSGPTAEALELLGMIRMAANDTVAARKCFEQAVYLEPGRTASLLQLAIISEGKGDSDRATTLWNRARRAPASGEGDLRR